MDIDEISGHIESINSGVTKMINERKKANKIEDSEKTAQVYCEKVKPLFDKVFEAGTPFNEDYAVVRDDQGMLFLIDKNGKPVKRFGPYQKPESMESTILKLL